jgi:hypothetical protein
LSTGRGGGGGTLRAGAFLVQAVDLQRTWHGAEALMMAEPLLVAAYLRGNT